jgi:hypothetical protein
MPSVLADPVVVRGDPRPFIRPNAPLERSSVVADEIVLFRHPHFEGIVHVLTPKGPAMKRGGNHPS